MKIVISYFNQTKMVASADEAIKFVNSLKYRGSAHHNLICNNYCSTFFQKYFSGEKVDFLTNLGSAELATTNCSTTRVKVYSALADTLEEHNKIVEERKAETKRIADEKAAIRHKEWLSEMYEPAKGWYVVTLDVLVSKIKGNDGAKTYSFKVLANNQMDAYDKACDLAMKPGGIKDRNVSFVYHVKDSASAAFIEYIGVWTDESELEYGPSK